jgi:hypothetical protein
LVVVLKNDFAMNITENTNPKDERITNDDNAVTNNDDTSTSQEPTEQDKPDEVRVPTVTPGNENGDPGPDEEPEDDSSNKGKGPAGENL